MIWVVLKKNLGGKFKNSISEDLHNLVVSICAKFEGLSAKTVGEVGFLRVAGFSKKITIAKFRLTVASLIVETSNLMNMTKMMNDATLQV